MSNYKVNGLSYVLGADEIKDTLPVAYRAKHRPVCLCVPNGVEMYIAKINEQYYIKRMPNTGYLHSPDCEHYETPSGVSGLGQVLDGAIIENPEDGTITMKLGFSLSKAGKTRPIPESDGESESVKTDGHKLTLRGTLHYLWEQAKFNKWTPNMEGKRNYFIIRKYLLQAAQNMYSKGNNFAGSLYIPETFSVDRKEEIARHRTQRMMEIASSKTARKLMVLVGEIKDFAKSPYGFKMVMKHMPDFAFYMNEDIYKRAMKRFANDLELKQLYEDSHLIAIATFGVSAAGLASIEELSMMTVTHEWIPFENPLEKELVRVMVDAKRCFTKSMRYNLGSKDVMASMVTNDTSPATAMYMVLASASDSYVEAVNDVIENSVLDTWRWDTANEIPALPSKNIHH